MARSIPFIISRDASIVHTPSTNQTHGLVFYTLITNWLFHRFWVTFFRVQRCTNMFLVYFHYFLTLIRYLSFSQTVFCPFLSSKLSFQIFHVWICVFMFLCEFITYVFSYAFSFVSPLLKCSLITPFCFLHLWSVLPRISPFHFDTPLFAGQTAQVACTVNEGDLPLNFYWTFNHKRNLPSGITINKMGSKMSVLLIDSVQSEHTGVYTCSVQNQAATVNYSDSLHVNGIPLCSLQVCFFTNSIINIVIFIRFTFLPFLLGLFLRFLFFMLIFLFSLYIIIHGFSFQSLAHTLCSY